MPKKILVIDDSSTVRQQVGIVLTKAGYEVLEAADGMQGAETIDHCQELAMVICDVNMPKMDGIEMLCKIKENGKHSELPVLMLTTEGKPTLITRAKEAGAKGWIVKPFKSEMLLATVRKLAGEA